MIKKFFINPKGLILSIPMIAMLLITFVFADKFPSTNEANNTFLTFWLIISILTLPWSIVIFIAGFVAVFSYGEWWGIPLFYLSLVCAVIFAHLNGIALISFFSGLSNDKTPNK